MTKGWKVLTKNSKTLLNLALLLATVVAGKSAYAEFAVDMDLSAIQPRVNRYGLTSQTFELLNDPRDQLLKSEGAKPGAGDMAIGRITWDGHIYYATGTQYHSREQVEEYRRASSAGEKNARTLPDGGVCELFLYDDKLQLVTRHKVKLPDFPGGTWCNGSEALGRARKDMPALLYSVHYYLVSEPVAARPEDIGKGWRHSTYLIRLAKDANGAIRFVQDDACLGNPNDYATIAQARKGLEKCSSSRPQ